MKHPQIALSFVPPHFERAGRIAFSVLLLVGISRYGPRCFEVKDDTKKSHKSVSAPSMVSSAAQKPTPVSEETSSTTPPPPQQPAPAARSKRRPHLEKHDSRATRLGHTSPTSARAVPPASPTQPQPPTESAQTTAQVASAVAKKRQTKAAPHIEAPTVLLEASEKKEAIQLVNAKGDLDAPAFRFPDLAHYLDLARKEEGLIIAWNPIEGERRGVQVGRTIELTSLSLKPISEAQLHQLGYSLRMGRLPRSEKLDSLRALVKARFDSLGDFIFVLALPRLVDNKILIAQTRWQETTGCQLDASCTTECRFQHDRFTGHLRFDITEVTDRFDRRVLPTMPTQEQPSGGRSAN